MKHSWLAAYALTLLFVFNGAVLGTCAYAVFWRGFSGWWFLLAIVLCASSSSTKSN